METSEIAIIEDAIAEFCGFTWTNDWHIAGYDSFFGDKTSPAFIKPHLCFTKDWNWFMYAYEKYRNACHERTKDRPHSATKADLIEVDVHCDVADFNLVRAAYHLMLGIDCLKQNPNKLNENKNRDNTGDSRILQDAPESS